MGKARDRGNLPQKLDWQGRQRGKWCEVCHVGRVLTVGNVACSVVSLKFMVCCDGVNGDVDREDGLSRRAFSLFAPRRGPHAAGRNATWLTRASPFTLRASPIVTSILL